MGNMADGQVYTCSECGLELKVTKPCDEEDCDLICCSKQMNQSYLKLCVVNCFLTILTNIKPKLFYLKF